MPMKTWQWPEQLEQERQPISMCRSCLVPAAVNWPLDDHLSELLCRKLIRHTLLDSLEGPSEHYRGEEIAPKSCMTPHESRSSYERPHREARLF